MNYSNFIIFSGGQGSGKTSLLDEMKTEGFEVKEEVGRRIITEEAAQGSNCLPWKDKQAFANKLFAGELDSLKSFKTSDDLVFWDRSIIDVYGYCKLEGLKISDQLLKACTEIKFSDVVFIFPPWKDIYLNDSERKQSFEQAINTYQVMAGC